MKFLMDELLELLRKPGVEVFALKFPKSLDLRKLDKLRISLKNSAPFALEGKRGGGQFQVKEMRMEDNLQLYSTSESRLYHLNRKVQRVLKIKKTYQ